MEFDDDNINIPVEIITEILVRLPVKPLSRFKSVSKTWYDLIQSQDFLKLHFIRSLKPDDNCSNNSSLILPINHTIFVNSSPTIVPALYRAYLNPNQTRLEITNLTLPPSILPSHFGKRFNNYYNNRKISAGKIDVVGSCNGLILIVSSLTHIAVCNPALEQHDTAFKFLPCLSSDLYDPDHFTRSYTLEYDIIRPYNNIRTYRSFSNKVFGFGYDFVNNYGYKIVYLSAARAFVYGIARDGGRNSSWRTIDLPFNILNSAPVYVSGGRQQSGVLMRVYGHGFAANNHLHWHITEYDPDVFEYSREAILSFDLCNEEWGELPVPEELARANQRCYSAKGYLITQYILELGVLDGCLCLLISKGISCPYIDLWIMKEYGVKESWSKLFKVPNGSGIPLFYRKDRYEFLLPGVQHGLGWFNPRDNKIRKVEFHGCDFSGEHYYSTRARLCFESFVHPFTSMLDLSL